MNFHFTLENWEILWRSPGSGRQSSCEVQVGGGSYFAMEEEIGSSSLSEGIVCWRSRKKIQCQEEDGEGRVWCQRTQIPVEELRSVLQLELKTGQIWSSGFRLLGGTRGCQVSPES